MATGTRVEQVDEAISKLYDGYRSLYQARSVVRMAIHASRGNADSEDHENAFVVVEGLIEAALAHFEHVERALPQLRPVDRKKRARAKKSAVDMKRMEEIVQAGVAVVRARDAEAAAPVPS